MYELKHFDTAARRAMGLFILLNGGRMNGFASRSLPVIRVSSCRGEVSACL
jgi:hypothetical protein